MCNAKNKPASPQKRFWQGRMKKPWASAPAKRGKKVFELLWFLNHNFWIFCENFNLWGTLERERGVCGKIFCIFRHTLATQGHTWCDFLKFEICKFWNLTHGLTYRSLGGRAQGGDPAACPCMYLGSAHGAAKLIIILHFGERSKSNSPHAALRGMMMLWWLAHYYFCCLGKGLVWKFSKCLVPSLKRYLLFQVLIKLHTYIIPGLLTSIQF